MVEPDVDEARSGLPPAELVVENARLKARAGLAAAPRGAAVLGVDTDVFLDEEALGQPDGRDGALERLRALSGRSHEVLSGVCLLGPREGEERTGVSRSVVTFAPLDDAALELYLGSGEWRSRAGAYAIQGLGSILVEKVEGDFSNVVGLPIRLLLRLAPELAPKP